MIILHLAGDFQGKWNPSHIVRKFLSEVSLLWKNSACKFNKMSIFSLFSFVHSVKIVLS